MTEALYLLDLTHAEVNVLECQLTQDGLFAVRLAETPFHPQGGGKPSDLGWINDVSVEHVIEQDNEIIHYCRQEIALGQAYAQVDLEKRQYFSRLHSAGHLIGHVMQELGWEPIKAQHWPEDSKVQFIKQEDAQDVDVESLQAICNQHIAQHLPRSIKQNSNGYREISFGSLQAFPCGETHVKNLFEIIEIIITEYKFKKGKLTIKYKIAEQQPIEL